MNFSIIFNLCLDYWRLEQPLLRGMMEDWLLAELVLFLSKYVQHFKEIVHKKKIADLATLPVDMNNEKWQKEIGKGNM